MKNRLQNLTETLQKFETGKVSFSEIAGEFVRFFEDLQLRAEKISAEQKEEFALLAVELFHQLAALISPYIEVTSLGEENLLFSLENPNYFDADDWKSATDAKEQIGELARKILPYLATAPQLEAQNSLKKDKKQPPRATKSQWMKS